LSQVEKHPYPDKGTGLALNARPIPAQELALHLPTSTKPLIAKIRGG